MAKGNGQELAERHPTILIKSRLSQLGRVIAVAGVSATVFGGCAWVPTWTGRVSYAGDAQEKARGPGPDDFDVKAACAAVIKAHNRIREDNKLPPLTISTKLQAAAQKHADDMATQQKMTHKGSDGSTAIKRIVSKGYNYQRTGENIATGQFTVDALMKGWMESPHHKRNILGSYSQIGVACAIDVDGKRYWCVTFGLPARR